jgi:pyruvate/2-oxoglutarate dehydrogenase complex dihydrolipoamide dehydrogenase (E3) component
VTVTYQDKDGEKTAEFDKLIVAVGRRPYAQGLLADMIVVLRKTSAVLSWLIVNAAPILTVFMPLVT